MWRMWTEFRVVGRGCAILALLLASGLLLGPALAQEKPKVPPDFTFDQLQGSPGKVTFSHEKHTAKDTKCTACHVKVFKMKKGTSGEMTMAAMKEGKFCGACHNGKEAFSAADNASCTKCHAKS
jgi:c(7)-type cytochrome triheme protein